MCSLRRYKVSFKSIEIVQEKGFPTHYSILLLILFHTHTHAVGIRVVNGLELLFHVNRMFLFRFKINHVPNFFFRFSSIYQHVHLSLAFNPHLVGQQRKYKSLCIIIESDRTKSLLINYSLNKIHADIFTTFPF